MRLSMNTTIKCEFLEYYYQWKSLVLKEIAKSSMLHLNKIYEHVNPLADMMLESTNLPGW